MKKYQVTWGWLPPQYDRLKDNFRLFFYNQEVEREVTHKDFETGEEKKEIIKEWLCDVVEYEGEEAKDILRMIKENKNSIECQKWILKEKIKAYDKSKYVNDFTINNIHLWLDSTMRSKVKENLETCQLLGEENTILRFDGFEFPITVETGWKMYYAVLKYARDSWNTTEEHLANIDKLETVDDLINYDYTVNYPMKLVF